MTISTRAFGAWLVAASLLVGCSPREKIIMLYPERSSGARDVFDVALTQQITLPDNFVLRPDELAAVAADQPRQAIYTGSREGTLLALDSESGGVRWEWKLGGAVSSIPTLAEDGALLLVGSDNGVLTALELETRVARWTYETQGTVRNAPVVGEGVVYFVNSRDEVYALDMRTGAWRWQYQRDFSTDFTIHGRAGLSFVPPQEEDDVDAAGTLYTGFDDGKVVAIDAASGQSLWIANVAPPEGGTFVDCDSTPLVDADAGELVVAGQSTGVVGLALADGTERWRRPVRGARSVVAGPAGLLLFSSSLEGLFAIERGGRVRWHRQLDPGVLSDAVVVGDTVFVTHSAAGLLAYDAREGLYLGRLDLGSGMSSVPSYDAESNRFYVISNRGVLLGLRVAGG